MRVTAIDSGITNIGLAVLDTSEERPLGHVVHCDKISLQNFGQGSRHITDRVNGFLASKHAHWLEEADVIVLEQQPPGGAGETMAALIYNAFIDKVVWISPVHFQNVNGIRTLDYAGRKEWTIDCAQYLAMESCSENWNRHERRHDMADAILFARHYAGEVAQQVPRKLHTGSFDKFTFRPRRHVVRSRFFTSPGPTQTTVRSPGECATGDAVRPVEQVDAEAGNLITSACDDWSGMLPVAGAIA